MAQEEALRIFFLPLLAPGHMLPMVDIAKLFARRGVKTAVITTPANAARIQSNIDRANNSGHLHIELLQIQFSSTVAGLPEGCENATAYRAPDLRDSFIEALNLLRTPFEQLVRERRPDCIVSDTYYPWTADIAGEFGIPRLVFHGPGYFAITAMDCLSRQRPHESVDSDIEPFVVPGLPHRIEMTKNQLPDLILTPPAIMIELGISHRKSYGAVVNSFYELEPDYVADIGGLKTWHIGPVSLSNSAAADQAVRGGGATASSGGDNFCLNWLDSKKPGSVLYVCFGSLGRFTNAQLREIAVGLENSGHPFIWVVRNDVGSETSEWMPEGFEDRITEEEKGVIIRGWSPQLLILNHGSTGGFLTHCGWNSSLEGITAGVPMITWPLFADQFFNEMFITHVLRIGIRVGVEKCSVFEEERVLVKAEQVKKAVRELMGSGEEAEGMRKRAREFGFMAKKAVEEGGSSYNSLSNLIEDLIEVKAKKAYV